MNVVTSPYLTWLYFGSLIVFGGYFAVDLLMGVLGNQYLRTKQSMKNMKKLKEEKNSKMKIAINAKIADITITDTSTSNKTASKYVIDSYKV